MKHPTPKSPGNYRWKNPDTPPERPELVKIQTKLPSGATYTVCRQVKEED